MVAGAYFEKKSQPGLLLAEDRHGEAATNTGVLRHVAWRGPCADDVDDTTPQNSPLGRFKGPCIRGFGGFVGEISSPESFRVCLLWLSSANKGPIRVAPKDQMSGGGRGWHLGLDVLLRKLILPP